MAKKKNLLTSILSILNSAIGGISNSNIKPKNVQELERKRANDLGEKYGLVGRAYANRTSGNESFRTTALRILNPGLGTISSLADASKQQKQAYKSGEIKKQTREVPKEEKTLKNTSIKSSNELQKYKEKNNINVFNENSKRVQNDKQYQKLLKQAQNDLNAYHDTQEKNIVESFTPEKGFVGQLQKGEYAVASGFSQGFEGIRNTTLKILGQTPTDRELKPTAMQQIQQKNRQNETNAISGAMQDMLYSYGQMMPQMALANMGSGVPTKGLQTATNLLSFSNYGGSAYQQARNEGYSDEQATRYGLVNGALETSLEKVLGGFESLYGKSATGKLTNTIMGKLIKNPALRKTLASMTGEFTEEYLQEFLDPIVREALLDEDNGVGIKDAKSIDELTKNIVNYTAQNFFSKENLYAGILGSLNSGMVEAPANFTRQAQMKAQGRDFDTGFTKEEQARIDKLTDSRVEQAVKEGATDNEKLRNKIQKEVINDIYQGNDNILEIMQDNFGEDITNLTNKRVQYETLTDQINELQDQFKNEIDNGGTNADAINNRIQELENQRRNLNYERDADTFNQRANEFLDKNYLFKESYNENQRSKQTYDRDISKYSKTQQESINEAQNYEWTDKEGKLHKGILDNSNRTASIVDLSSKIAEKIGAKVRYVNDSVLEQEGIIKKGRKVNGYNVNGEIVINLDSARRLEYTTGHEITHSLEGTDAYNKLQSYLKEFVGEKEWNNRKSQIEENYADVSGVDIDSEITSDLVGEYLFNNTEFINNLSTNKSLFNKIYNEIKYMYNLATAGSKEQRDLERLKKKFADALKNSKQEVKDASFPDTRYSLSVKEANTGVDNQGNKVAKGMQEFMADSKATDENGNLITVYHTTTDAIPQFNEFNPVGTEGYKYGDQVVNFFTNSKTMSGSYADYEYNMADTKKIKDFDGVKELLQDINEKTGNWEFRLTKNLNDTYFLYDNKNKLDSKKTKLYKTKEELFKNIKQDLQEKSGLNNGNIQYEGYLNIKKPYVIDAKEANWDSILTGYDEMSVRYANEISQEDKQELIDLAKESKRKNDAIYDELKELYSKEWDIKKEYPYLKEEEYKKYLTKKDYNQWQKIQNRIEEIKSKQHYDDDYFRENVGKLQDKINNEFNMNYSDYDLYRMANTEFERDNLKRIFGRTESTNDIVKYVLDRNKQGDNYDGVIIKNVLDYGSTTEFDDNGAAQDVYVTFNSNQFKNVDNTTPTKDADIRYSLSENGKMHDNTTNEDITLEVSELDNVPMSDNKKLMAMHNLNEEKLNGILDLGGIPVPSIAITNPDIVAHTNFGEATALFDKSTIDPKIKANEVYDRDIWSPTFPRVEYEISEKALNKIRKVLNKDDTFSRESYTKYVGNLEDSINRNGIKNVRKDMLNDTNLKEVFINQDNSFKPVMKTEEVSYSQDFSNEFLKQFADTYGKEIPAWHQIEDADRKELMSKFKEEASKYLDATREDAIKRANEKYDNNPPRYIIEMAKTHKDNVMQRLNALGYEDKIIEGLNKLQNNESSRTIIDREATANKINELIDNDAYEKWVDNLLDGVISKKGIRNDKEIFTPSGNRRSFNALHEDYNLSNIVKHLTSHNTIAGEEGFGAGQNFGTLQAKMSTRFNSIEDIKNASDRLVTNDHDIREEYSNIIYDDMSKLREYSYYKSNDYYYGDNAGYSLNDFADYSVQNVANLKKALEKNGINSKEVPLDLLQKVVDDVNSLKNLPTDYFEAKPQRAVDLSEIRQMVIPNTWSDTTKQRMTDAGIEYTEYDPNVENARNDAIKSFDNLRFSLTQAEQNDLDGLQALEDSGWTELTPEEAQRKAELERKRDIETKYPELENIKSYKDLGSKYYNYQDLDDFNSKVLDRIKDTATGKKRNGKKVFTKDQWLSIAEMVGSNLNAKTSAELEKYAVQSWFSEHPNRKENLNREGKKYNRFTIDEWVNAVYKGAGVGEEITQTKKQAPLEQILTENTPLTEQDLDDFERFNNERPIDNEIAPPEQETQPIEDTNQPLKQIILEKQNKSKKGIKTSEEQTIKTAQEVQEEKQNNKIRKFVESAVDSEAVNNLVDIQDLDTEKINYVPISNKKTLDSANTKYDSLGYDESLNYIKAKINDKNVTLDDIALAERLIQESARKGDVQTTSDLIMDTAIIGTELGQKVQALSIIKRLTPEGQLKALNKIVNRNKSIDSKQNIWGDVKITDAMAKEILGAYKQDGSYDQNDLNNRVENVKQQIADQMKVTIGDKLNAWRYLSMLGNPKTHLRNIISNVAMKGAFEVKNATARTIEDVFLSENRTKTWKKSSQVVKDFAKQMTQDLKGEITGEGKFNETSEIENERKIFKTKAMNFISDFNSNMLEGEDWFFSSRAFESTFREYLTAQGIKTQADIDNNPEIVQKGINHSIEQAQIATFRQYSKLASMINGIENKSKVGKLAIESVIPFKKTPINVAKAGLSYSPLGLIKSVSYDAYQVKTGNMEASTMIDHMAQGLTGTSLTLLGYALAKAGILKGSGGDDKDDKYDNYLGKQSYSINIGGQSFSLSWLSPVAMPLFVGVEAKEQLEDKENWDFNVIAETLAQTLDPLNEMSFMQGLTQTLSGYTSGTGKIKGMFENTAQNYVLQFFPTLFSQIASTLDDKKRSTKADKTSKWVFGDETIRKIMYKIPGLRNQLEVSTDIWGNEQEQADNIITRAFESFISPTTRKQDISTGLDDEIKRVYKQTNEKGVIPSIPYSYINYNGEKYDMTSSEYTAYKKTYGRTANEMLNSLVASSGYQNATDEEKAKMIEDTYKYASAIAKDEFFSGRDVEYQNDSLTEYNELNDLGMGYDDIAEYTTLRSLNNSIKNNKELSAEEKRLQISNNLINSNLDDEQLAYAYSKYYGDAKTMKNVVDANIPIKEYIKFKSQDIKGDVGANGKTISGSRLRNVVKYVNSLNLTKVQKAMLIKSEYASYTKYDNLIFNYINSQNLDFYSKASLLRKLGFKGRKLNSQILDYIDKNYETLEDKIKALEDMGFKTYQKNGKTYVRS